MKENAPTATTAKQSASHYTIDAALKSAISELLTTNDGRLPTRTVQNMLGEDGFTRAEIMDTLDELARQGKVAFQIEQYSTRPFRQVRLFVVEVT